MNERKRNIAVGLTVLVALCGLGFMIVLFGEVPAFLRSGYTVWVTFPHAGGIEQGADVRLNGVRIGTAARVELNEDPAEGVLVECRINRDILIPGDVQAFASRSGLSGSGHVSLNAPTPKPGALEPKPLPTDGSARLTGQIASRGLLGGDLDEKLEHIVEGFDSFRRLADNINMLLMGEAPSTQPTTAPGQVAATEPTGGLGKTLDKLNDALDSFNALVGDDQARADLHASLANLREATEAGTQAMNELRDFAGRAASTLDTVDETASSVRDAADATRDRMQELTGSLIEDAERLSELLATLNRAATKIEAGDGTAGRLINDPQLYENLLESAQQLSRTLTELRTTIRQWREEGVRMRIN